MDVNTGAGLNRTAQRDMRPERKWLLVHSAERCKRSVQPVYLIESRGDAQV